MTHGGGGGAAADSVEGVLFAMELVRGVEVPRDGGQSVMCRCGFDHSVRLGQIAEPYALRPVVAAAVVTHGLSVVHTESMPDTTHGVVAAAQRVLRKNI